ncbi:MAG: Uncharacterised protein [Cellulomonadaceae bacterium TMED98]|nr:MAG: Uncharacterised protein [Cellulomonadaceae bacterium TMED98]
MENLELVEFFAGGGKEDVPVGHSFNAESRATFLVTVEFGEHHTGEVDTVLEGFGRVDGVLTDHGVDHKQHFVRVHGFSNRPSLGHHLFVDTGSTSGVDDDNVVEFVCGKTNRVFGDFHRVAHTTSWFRSKHGNTCLLADNLQLVDSAGALQVTGDQDGCVAVAF